MSEPTYAALANYCSHDWCTRRASSSPDLPIEWVTFCSVCLLKNEGNPTERPELEYPHCDDMGD
jgi:hypothetical protein